MCDAGRIRHHLKANLWRKNATVMMAGFQAQGSLGRILIDGATRVRIQGEEVQVKARIRQFDLYSGHADATELVAWVEDRLPVRQAIFLTHGEEVGSQRAAGSPVRPVLRRTGSLPRISTTPIELSAAQFRRVDVNEPHRLNPEKVARLDWHNDLSKLLLDISEAVDRQADERGRAAVIRRLKRALDATSG